MLRILILHGPNLQALGTREPEVYGRVTLEEVNASLVALAGELGCEIETLQSAHEGVLIDTLYQARGRFHGVVCELGKSQSGTNGNRTQNRDHNEEHAAISDRFPRDLDPWFAV